MSTERSKALPEQAAAKLSYTPTRDALESPALQVDHADGRSGLERQFTGHGEP